MIRIELPDGQSGGSLIRELLGSVDAACLSLDPDRREVRVEDGAASPGAVAQAVERWLEQGDIDQARVHDGRGSFVVQRRHRSLRPVGVQARSRAARRYPPEPELSGA